MGCAASVRIKDAEGMEVQDTFHLLQSRARQEEPSEIYGGEVIQRLSHSEPNPGSPGRSKRCQRVEHITSEQRSALADSLLDSQGCAQNPAASARLRRPQSCHALGVNEYTRKLAAGKLKSLTPGAVLRKD